MRLNNYEELKSKFSKECLYDALWKQNKTYRELQNEYNYNERLFSKLAKEYGILKNNIATRKNCNNYHSLNLHEKSKEILNMYLNENKSVREISNILSCNHASVSKFLRDRGIEIRSGYDDIYYSSRRKEYSKFKSLDTSGYQVVSTSGNQIREHRYIMEKHLGRKLTSSEMVHHIDQDKTNNSIENLFLFKSNAIHHLYHGYIKRNDYIHPKDFVFAYSDILDYFLSYDNLYREYIILENSCNGIAKDFNSKYKHTILNRTTITRHLKNLGIYELREPTVNQYEQL